MANIWKSDRLVYRAVEDDDDPFFTSLNINPAIFTQSNPALPRPQGKASGKDYREWVQNKCLMGAVICLPPTPEALAAATAASAEAPKPTPIGAITLFQGMPHPQHRNAMIGLGFLEAYHRMGYGTEAIKWTLNWGFRFGNLHRIAIGAYSYNAGAIRLYERLGFIREGVKRESVWFDGQYWDTVDLAMLDREWKELYGTKAKGDEAINGVKS